MQFKSVIIVMVVWCGYIQPYQTEGGGPPQKLVKDSKVTQVRAVKLVKAIKIGSMDYLNYWIDQGRSLDLCIGKEGYTPLHLAVLCNRPHMVQRILSQQVPLNNIYA